MAWRSFDGFEGDRVNGCGSSCLEKAPPRGGACSRSSTYFPDSIFSFTCFAQASAVLRLPCAESDLFTEYAKTTALLFRLVTVMLACSLECQLPMISFLAVPAFL